MGRRAFGVLVVSRVLEQGAYGAATLVLAARLSVREFGVVSILLVANALAVAASDFGLGLDLLRRPPDEPIATSALRRTRLFNLGVAAAGLVVGAALGQAAGVVVASASVMWGASAEAYIRKAGALRHGHATTSALAEILGSSAFLGIVLVAAHGSVLRATTATGLAIVTKHVVEIATVRHWRAAFAGEGARPRPGAVWISQIMAYGIANLDYLIVGPILGPVAFGVYVLAFRMANALPAQLASVVSRVSLADFGRGEGPAERQASYDRFVGRLFAAGLVGALLTAGVAPLLPHLLGRRWNEVVPVAVILAIGVPWRLGLGLAGTLALSADAAPRLVRWETARAVTLALVYGAAALVNFRCFVASVTLTSVLATLVEHYLAGRAAGIRPWRGLVPAGLLSLIVAVLAALTLGS